MIEGNAKFVRFSVVPNDYELPENIDFEILSELYLPEADRMENDPSDNKLEFTWDDALSNKNMFLDVLEGEAQEIVGEDNTLNSYVGKSRMGLFKRNPLWRAHATYTVFDTESETMVGVQNAEVTLRNNLFTYKRKQTNANGYVDFGSPYRNDAKYEIKFKTNDFTLKNGYLSTIELSSTNKRDHRYVRTFPSENDKYWFYATLHNSADKYYNEYVGKYSLTRPNNKNIKAKDEADISNHNLYRGWFLGSELHITRFTNSGTQRNTRGVFEVAVHELTHASHAKFESGIFSIDDYNSCNKQNDFEKAILKESWANCVEAYLTNDEFNLRLENGSNNALFMQTHSFQDMSDAYTPLFVDLIDTYDQRDRLNSINVPNDKVSGYTLFQIERVLDESRDLNTLRDRLKSRYDNSTETHLNNLFINYSDLWNLPNKEICD